VALIAGHVSAGSDSRSPHAFQRVVLEKFSAIVLPIMTKPLRASKTKLTLHANVD
jgi:hypothetical protein